MSRRSGWEINVSKRVNDRPGAPYLHLFATHERSCTTDRELYKVHGELIERFLEPEYKVDVTYWECKGTKVGI